MVYGRYKNTSKWIIKDDSDGKWFARDISAFSHTEKFDTIDQLRDALRLGNVTWTKNFSN